MIDEQNEQRGNKMKSGDVVIKSLNELVDVNSEILLEWIKHREKAYFYLNKDDIGNSEIIKELLSITKNIDTRLSALDITVQYIEKNRVATDSEKASFLVLIDNLQEQVDVITKAIYTKEK
tara:strand:+ start:2988 stop:3350 length:363 start_codon:yes stop_codon:yes gene_type:complete